MQHRLYHDLNSARFPASGGIFYNKGSNAHMFAWGTTVPTDGTAGYMTGCLFVHTDGGAGTALYVNEGSATSCDFNPLGGEGNIARGDLTEDALQVYGIPIGSIRAKDGAALGISETAGDHFLNLGTNTIVLEGEEAISETETSESIFQFILPPEYVSGGDIKVRVKCQLTGAGTDNSSTVDVEVFKQDGNGAIGSDICATAAQGFAAKGTWYTKDFTVTATGLVAGDILNIVLTSSVIESAGSALAFQADGIAVLCDIKG